MCLNRRPPGQGGSPTFTTELMGKIDSLPNTFDPTLTAKELLTRSIKVVPEAVEKMNDTFPSVRQYFTQCEEHKQNDEKDKSINSFFTSVHFTFVHASKMRQTSMSSSFQHLIGDQFDGTDEANASDS